MSATAVGIPRSRMRGKYCRRIDQTNLALGGINWRLIYIQECRDLYMCAIQDPCHENESRERENTG